MNVAVTEQDIEVASYLIRKRRELQAELSGLTDSAIAEKLELSRHDVREISRGIRSEAVQGLG